MKLIASVDENWGIGNEGNLLYKLPEDMKHFKKITIDSRYVIMGRKTFESLGAPLEYRTNLILTRDKNYISYIIPTVNHDTTKVQTFHCINDIMYFIDKLGISSNVCIIGGAEIYKKFLPLVDTAYITEIKGKAKNVDTYFPERLDFSDDWKLVHSEQGSQCVKLGIDYRFNEYRRRN